MHMLGFDELDVEDFEAALDAEPTSFIGGGGQS